MPMTPHKPEDFDGAISTPVIIDGIARPMRSRRTRIAQTMTSFIFGQGAMQAINTIAGFILVHQLSIEAYAQFGIAMAFQAVFGILVDLGLASTIVPLVGNRREDRALVGRYVRAAVHLRGRGFWCVSPIAAVAFLAMIHQYHWGWTVQLFLVCAVLLSLYSSGTVSCFSAPIFIFGRFREYYLPQVVFGASRLLLYLGLATMGSLNAITAAGLGALNVTVSGAFIRRASLNLISWPDKEDFKTDKELLQYTLPASPAIIFAAFQMQISLFLVSLFGSALYIAQVSALSRIGAIFAALMTFNTTILEPYLARHSIEGLRRTFVLIALMAVLICVPVVLVAFCNPEVFLWLLGAKYDGVRQALGWYVLSGSMNFVAGVIWIMNRARKWVFWSGSIIEVILLLVVQMAFLGFIGVRNTNQAVMFNVASSCCYLIAHLYVTIYGFSRRALTHE